MILQTAAVTFGNLVGQSGAMLLVQFALRPYKRHTLHSRHYVNDEVSQPTGA